MSATRRTALAMLGLAPASAIGSETFTGPADPSNNRGVRSVVGSYDRERYARVFETLAAELRKDSVELQNIELKSVLNADALADVHDLTVRFRYLPELS